MGKKTSWIFLFHVSYTAPPLRDTTRRYIGRLSKVSCENIGQVCLCMSDWKNQQFDGRELREQMCFLTWKKKKPFAAWCRPIDASHEVWFWHVCTFEKCGRSCNFMQLFSTCESHLAALGNVEESVLNQIGVKVLIWLCSTLLLWSAFVTNCKVQHLESINNLLLWVLFSFGFKTLLT